MRLKDRKTKRQKDKTAERQNSRKTKRQNEKKLVRPKDLASDIKEVEGPGRDKYYKYE